MDKVFVVMGQAVEVVKGRTTVRMWPIVASFDKEALEKVPRDKDNTWIEEIIFVGL